MRNTWLLLLLLFTSTISAGQHIVRPDTAKKPIPWDPIRENDILWKKRVWRVAEVNNPRNTALQYNAKTPAENLLGNVLVSGLRAGKFSAYRDDDTGFTAAIPIFDLNAKLQCDTCTYPQQVGSYLIKEDWLFDRNRGVMVVRIQALGVATTVAKDSLQVLFWVKYSDVRPHFAQFEAYGKNNDYRYTWDEYFESRQFASKIIKVDGGTVPPEDSKETLPPPTRKKKKKKHVADEMSKKEKDAWSY